MQVFLLSILRLCCGQNLIKSIPRKPNELVTTITNTKAKRECCPNKNTKYIGAKQSEAKHRNEERITEILYG